MTPTLHDSHHRHADRILEVVGAAFHGSETDVVAQSWRRCVNDYQLHPDKPRDPLVVARAELEERRERRADVIACARYEMTTLFQQLADMEAAVVLTDTDGVILHMVSSPEFAAEVAPLGMRVGGTWSEDAAGTNGMGTCLAAAVPVSVRRDDHFFSRFTQLTCSAVPVYDPSGEITAVLDVSSRSSLMQQHLLVLLGMTARMIENRLIDRRFRNAHPLHFHSRPEFIYTLHEGKLAVSPDGRILAANRSALFQLGMQSMDEVRARRIDDLFQTSLEDILQRSTTSSFHPVVTYRANAALRFFAVMRQPALDRPAGVGPSPAARPPAAALAPPASNAASQQTARSEGDATFSDPRLVAHLDTARRVIAHRTPVLLCGETGTGKEVFAKAVHHASPHARGAFVAVNCASLPETLIEAELFGYRAGAFTGADRQGRRGKILQADGGTLFLDEIADMPLELQARLLRVLDERRVTPLGSEDTHAVDFQLISASHQHLPQRVQEGRFREDLYYRLAGIELLLPPLRERSDKRELMLAVLRDEGGAATELSADAEQVLLGHAWPGNIRQLRHVLRTAAALADGKTITRAHLPSMPAFGAPVGVPLISPLISPLTSPMSTPVGAPVGALMSAPAGAPLHTPPTNVTPAPPATTSLPATATADAADPACAAPFRLNAIQANERQVVLQMLEQHRWNVSNVAKALDISRNTLYRKLHKLHIEVSHPE
jgi:sigma-54 dependent transcriptional regulator, acetoin dehydrogenase operon transcriptional activator AcoR